MTVRSARNNNPGNIESNSTAWVGKTGDDGRFVTYATPEHGVRAMGKTLETYQDKHGLTSVNQMIARWAPPNENNTTNYANFVATEMGISPDAEIDLSANPELAQKMVGAMIKMEGGLEAYNYFKPAIKGGLDMAYGNIDTPEISDVESSEFMDINEPPGEGIDALDPTQKEEAGKQILNTATSLEEVVDRMERLNIFWDNELDNFQNYTYNIELFQVNQGEARNYLRLENTPDMLLDVVNDGWPKAGMKKITIAKTGVSAELVITDVQIRGTGYGAVSLSRMAGTATELQFQITQVGGTSLPDMLQNAALLSGYTSIFDSIYFMKIKFMGYDDDNQIVRDFPATKVLPFKIKQTTDLDTTTDARGTSVLLSGNILTDEVVNSTDVSKVESNFEFATKDTLEETLEEFMDKLNKNVIQNSVLDSTQFIHTYKISMSEEFKQRYGQADMRGIGYPNYASANNETEKKAAVKISQSTGVVQPGHSIYECLHNIIINAKQVREELTASEKKMTEIFVIKPHAVPKENGFNVLTNKSAYDVTFYVTLHESLLPQNAIHNAMLSQATADILKQVFLKGRCHKRYYYQYTGKNDQIIDFQIQLRRQLEKIYSKPSDQYMANTFLDAIGDYRKNIDKKAQQKLTELEAEAKVLLEIKNKTSQNVEQLTSEFDKMQDELASEFERRLRANGVDPDQLGGDEIAINAADINYLRESLKRGNGQTKEGTIAYEIFNDIFKGETRENFNKLNNLVRQAKLDDNSALNNLEENYRENDDVMREALGHLLSKKFLESTTATGEAWDELGITATNLPGQEIVLIEQLDKEIIQKLSLDQFDALMKTLIENPVNFNRITKPILSNPTRLKVIKHPDQEEVEVALSKYYEGRSGNLSMQNASMTIKGDPYWLETFIPVEIEKKNFSNKNSNEQFKMHSSSLNGANYCLVIADKAEGNYLENSNNVGQDAANSDGIKKTRLETMVYQVNDIIHSFSGGQFTQTLEMVKHPAASTFQQSSLTFGIVDGPTLWTEDRAVAHTDIPAELGTNDGTGTGGDGSGKDGAGQSAEAGNIAPPEGAGNALVDTDGDGEGDTVVVENTDAAYLAASAAYKNATGLFIDNDGVDGIPEEADAKQLALVTSQLQDLCNLGNQAACSDLAMGRQQIVNHFGDADEARNIINESIDDGTTVSSATIAMLDNTYESLGQEKISDGITGVDQDEIDAWSEQIDKDMDKTYLGPNDALNNPNQVMSELEPGGLFGKAGTDAMLNGDVQLYDGGMKHKQTSTITGGQTREYSFDTGKKTLTAQEFNQVQSLHDENQDLINGRSLWDLTDTEYAQVKANENAINKITENATTGVRGEVRNEVIDKEKRENISQLKLEEQELEDELDGFYFTNKGRQEDEQKLNEVREQILIDQIESSPIVMTEVQELTGNQGGSNFKTDNLPKTTEDSPIIVPKPDVLPDVYVDNNDGTITVPPPPPNTYSVTPSGNTAIDNLNVPDDVKDEYKEVLESNNGLKVKQFIDDLPVDQANEIYQLQQTQDLVEYPGSQPAVLNEGVDITGITESDKKQLAAARSIYDNISKQAETLPRRTLTQTYGDETFVDQTPDMSFIEPVKYIDADGNVQEYVIDTSKVDTENGWTVPMLDQMKKDIASKFPSIGTGKTEVKRSSAGLGEPIRIGIGNGDVFAIEVEVPEQEGPQ